MTTPFLRRTAVLAAATLTAVGVASAAPAYAAPGPSDHGKATNHTTQVRLITLNDFHGNLQPPAGSSGRVTLDNGDHASTRGGAAYLATHVKQLRARVPQLAHAQRRRQHRRLPLPSALFHDEPTIDFLNTIGLDRVGGGQPRVRRGLQGAAAHPVRRLPPDRRLPCSGRPYDGAKFPFLGANVTFDQRPAGRTAVHRIKVAGGIPIGVIGVDPRGPAERRHPVRDRGPEVRRRGHRDQHDLEAARPARRPKPDRGAAPGRQRHRRRPERAATWCRAGPAPRSPRAPARASTLIFTGHSHQPYNCSSPTRRATRARSCRASSFGRLLSVRRPADRHAGPGTSSGRRPSRQRDRHPRRHPGPGGAGAGRRGGHQVAPIANRLVGTITADITRAAPAQRRESHWAT